jgi:uncharacterized protein (DUF697 family)
LDVPVILVITQAPRMPDGKFHPQVAALLDEIRELRLPVVPGSPFPVVAMPDPYLRLDAYGLGELLDATFQAVPEAVHLALSAAQEIDPERKRAAAYKAVGTATAAAVAAATVPIPFVDAAALVPIQVGMMASISLIYKIKVDKASLATIAAPAVATGAGRALVGTALKFIPGIGTVAGGAIKAAVASSFTAAMGRAWIEVCDRLTGASLDAVIDAMNTDEVKRMFLDQLRPGAKTG